MRSVTELILLYIKNPLTWYFWQNYYYVTGEWHYFHSSFIIIYVMCEISSYRNARMKIAFWDTAPCSLVVSSLWRRQYAPGTPV
jgi:hypothetical protein